MRHTDLIFLHHFHKIHHHFCNIDLSHIQGPILRHQFTDIFIQYALIWFLFKFTQCHDCFLDHADIIFCNAADCFSDQFFIPFGQSSHHSHIDPYNLAILDLYISRVGICMKETVFHHLFDIIIDQLDPDLFQIVSACQKFLFIIDRRPFDVFHDQHMHGCIFLI